MKKSIFVIAPHPDDEVLGCGGTLLRLKDEGAEIHWVIVTKMGKEYSKAEKNIRENLIKEVSKIFNFSKVHQLPYLSGEISDKSMKNIIINISDLIRDFSPSIIFTPFYGDVHSDHRIIANAVISASKPFRAKSVKTLLAYEVPSETNFAFKDFFQPKIYYNISNYMDEKINILKLYKSELGQHPFPRSLEASKNLAKIRGSESDNLYAEAFHVIRMIF
tara:strand:- start:5494 stop:6150 length:657 start_codon:yes stop_codon:yes gene_type:complete